MGESAVERNAAFDWQFNERTLKYALFRELERRAGPVREGLSRPAREACVDDLWQRVPAGVRSEATFLLSGSVDRPDTDARMGKLFAYLTNAELAPGEPDPYRMAREGKTGDERTELKQEMRRHAEATKLGQLREHYGQTPEGADEARRHVGRAPATPGSSEDHARKALWDAFEQRVGNVDTANRDEAVKDLWSRTAPEYRADAVDQMHSSGQVASPTADAMLNQASGRDPAALGRLKDAYERAPAQPEAARKHLSELNPARTGARQVTKPAEKPPRQSAERNRATGRDDGRNAQQQAVRE